MPAPSASGLRIGRGLLYSAVSTHVRRSIPSALLLLALTAGAAAQLPAAGPGRVWPQPPDPPRIRYLQSFTRSADLGWKPSLWQRFKQWARSERDLSLMSRPMAVAVNSRGEMIVADAGTAEVKIFNPRNKSVKAIRGYKQRQFGAVVSVAVDDADNIYVADSAAGRVLKYSRDGKFLAFVGGEEGAFKQPAAVAFNPANRLLYVLDTGRPRVFAYSLDGAAQKLEFGAAGDGEGQFNLPSALAIDRQGRLYVNDSLNFRLQVFTLEGKLITRFGESGDGSGSFNRPKGIAVDSEGHIYVAEALFAAIQIFDLEGRYLLSFGDFGGGPGQFYLPAGVAIDAQNRIYVTDPYHRRVQVFQYLPAPGGAGGRP